MTTLDKMHLKLRQKGVKLTEQRKELLAVLEKLHHPVSAEEIFLLLKEHNPGPCLATIYRNLDVLVQNQIVRQLQLSDTRRVYELSGDDHYHYLVCLGCSKTVRLENCPIQHYEESVSRDTDFTIIEHRLSMYGYCPACKPQI